MQLTLDTKGWNPIFLGLVLFFSTAPTLPAVTVASEPAIGEEASPAQEHTGPVGQGDAEDHGGEHESKPRKPPYLGSLRSWFFVSMLPDEDDAKVLGLEFESYFDLGPYRVKNISYFELANYPRPIPGQPPGNPSPGLEVVDYGLGDLLSGFWASKRGKPHRKHHVAWGAAFQFPTADADSLGSGKFSLGPAVDYEYESGKWFAGFIALNLWSVAVFCEPWASVPTSRSRPSKTSCGRARAPSTTCGLCSSSSSNRSRDLP